MANLRASLLLMAAIFAAAPARSQPAPPVTLIHAGMLLAVPGQAPRARQTIFVQDGRIVDVRNGFVDLAGATVIDLGDKFVLPGLMDMHVHLDGELGPSNELDAVKLSDQDVTLQAAIYAERTLQAGFTTVRNLGGSPAIKALRDAAARGRVAAPTIVDAGTMISVTGGHGDVHGFGEAVTAVLRRGATTCDGADDCAKMTREVIRRGADVVKIASTGGVLSAVAGGLGQQMSDAEIKAVVDTAHGFGRKVAAHSHAKDGIDAALKAGVDSIEHGSFTDRQSIALFKQSGAYLVPTLLAPHDVIANIDKLGISPASAAKAREAASQSFANTKAAIAAGVKIAFGTDTGVSPHGGNAREFKLLVDAGMTPAQAIRSATVGAADLLGQTATVGTIEPGKRADIIAVAGDPLSDVTALEKVDFVMARGTVFKQGGERQAFAPR